MSTLLLNFQLRIIPSKTTQSCAVTSSDPGKVIKTFDSREFGLSQPGIYTLYRHRALPVEVQAHFRPCSLGELCTCAVGVRVDDVITVLDVCTKGHLQAWSWTQSGRVPEEEDRLPEGFEVVSVDEGREYKVGCLVLFALHIRCFPVKDFVQGGYII